MSICQMKGLIPSIWWWLEVFKAYQKNFRDKFKSLNFRHVLVTEIWVQGTFFELHTDNLFIHIYIYIFFLLIFFYFHSSVLLLFYLYFLLLGIESSSTLWKVSLKICQFYSSPLFLRAVSQCVLLTNSLKTCNFASWKVWLLSLLFTWPNTPQVCELQQCLTTAASLYFCTDHRKDKIDKLRETKK